MKKQRGATLIGMLFVSIALVLIALLGMKVLPTMLEYQTILKAVKKAGAEANTAADVKTIFDKASEIEQNISSITAKDLIIERVNGGYRVSFAYNKEIALFGPAFLVIKYAGSSGKGDSPPSPTGGV